jgi:ppGpp synthetase/RelA/SpoT-type nucleotidyltranferase
MIIPDSFKQCYKDIEILWQPIKEEVDAIFHNIVLELPGINYYSRIKTIESVYLKSLKGDYLEPLKEMEDFFGATIVIPVLSIFSPLKERAVEFFEFEELIRKPREPFDFQYNDLHFILKLKDSPLRIDKTVLRFKFELQIKTLLQSAWQQANHDVIYKPVKISWGNERIAYQLRALLELADSVLAQIEATAKLLHASAVQEQASYKPQMREIIETMEKHFTVETLPQDHRRMADIVRRYLDIGDIDSKKLDELLIAIKITNNSVFELLTLTPIEKVFLVIYFDNQDRVRDKLRSGKHKVLITKEMEDFFPELKSIDEKGRVKLSL